MFFEDGEGRLLTSEEVDNLSPWEIEALELHVFEGDIDFRKLHIYQGC